MTYDSRMPRSDRLAAIALLAALGAVLLLTELRSVWADPALGWAAPWGLWAGLVAAGVAVARLAPRDHG